MDGFCEIGKVRAALTGGASSTCWEDVNKLIPVIDLKSHCWGLFLVLHLGFVWVFFVLCLFVCLFFPVCFTVLIL